MFSKRLWGRSARRLATTLALGVTLAGAPICAQGQQDIEHAPPWTSHNCHEAAIEAERVAVDRDSGLPRDLALKHLLNTVTQELGSMPDDKVLRKDLRRSGAKMSGEMVTIIYGPLRDLRPDVIKIQFESACLNNH